MPIIHKENESKRLIAGGTQGSLIKTRNICPICEGSAVVTNTQHETADDVQCKSCGHYLISNDVDIENETLRCCLFYYLTKIKISHVNYVPYLHNDATVADGFNKDMKVYCVQAPPLEKLFPQTFSERIDMTLLNLARVCGSISDGFNYWQMSMSKNTALKLACFITHEDGLDGRNELLEFFDLLCEMQLIAFRSIVGSGKTSNYKITANGWLKIQQLQEQKKVLKQGFIAMSFDPSLAEARESIIKAIESCGYDTSIIDIKEHNNQIVPEIFHEIKRSQFVVADLTGHKNGVYYEAGYAEALGKEVILTCQKASKAETRPHFDVAQKNTIFWEDEADLLTRLVNRIDATVGKLN
ncbi:MAG: hypothetical protein RRZ73_01495 [Oscillospiraceae bacterium]